MYGLVLGQMQMGQIEYNRTRSRCVIEVTVDMVSEKLYMLIVMRVDLIIPVGE